MQVVRVVDVVVGHQSKGSLDTIIRLGKVEQGVDEEGLGPGTVRGVHGAAVVA